MNPEVVALFEENGWQKHTATRDGRPVALVFIKGCEIHFESLDHGKAMTRKNTLEFLRKIYDQFNFVTTRVPLDVTDHKLRKVLGFRYIWQDAQFSYWYLDQLPFQKVKHDNDQRRSNPTRILQATQPQAG